jgi:hypothetical protein
MESPKESAIAFIGLTSRNDPQSQSGWGDWIWVGDSDNAQAVGEALANDGRLERAFELGGQLCIVEKNTLIPAQFRRAKQRVRYRLELGPLPGSQTGEEQYIEVPLPLFNRETNAFVSYVPKPVLVPSPFEPFAFHVVQLATEEAENIAATTVFQELMEPPNITAGSAATEDLNRKEAPDEEPGPHNHAGKILIQLLNYGADCYEKRLTTEKIARRFPTRAGEAIDPNNLKRPMAKLNGMGLVETRDGRGGGCWLSPSGKTAALRISLKP